MIDPKKFDEKLNKESLEVNNADCFSRQINLGQTHMQLINLGLFGCREVLEYVSWSD